MQSMPVAIVLLFGMLAAVVPQLGAQSMLDRSPNVSGDRTGTPGALRFNFMYRFSASDPPSRKMSSSPTLLPAESFARRTLEGSFSGTADTRFGFEFTMPVTLSRYFGEQRTGEKTPTPAEQAPPEGRRDTVRVSMVNSKFDAERIEIPVGTTVVWTNDDQAAHSATGNNGSFNTWLIGLGKEAAVTFGKPGTFAYYCMPHPFMRGVVVVR